MFEQFHLALSLYWESIVYAALLAWVVAEVGIHLMVRKQTLEVLPLAQFAVLGALISGVFELALFLESLVVGAAAAFWVLIGSRTTFTFGENLGAVFFAVVLFCINHCAAAIFPSVFDHFSPLELGDLAALSHDRMIMGAIILVCLLSLVFWRRASIQAQTQWVGIYGRPLPKGNTLDLVFKTGVIAVSVWTAGVLFTLATLLLPLLTQLGAPDARSHRMRTRFCAVAGTMIGFTLSAGGLSTPTTPTLILGQVVLACILGRFQKIPVGA